MEVVEAKDKVTSNKNFMRPRSFDSRREPSEFEERVIEVRRVSRTVKGGRRISFRALVVIGNKKGKVSMGIAKAGDVAEAVRKAVAKAKKKPVIVPIINGTIPYEVTYKYGSAVVMLRPASEGTSIVAGGAVRVVAELAGITDLLSKMMGSPSKVNNIVATIKAFESFNPEYVAKVKKMIERRSGAEAKNEGKVVTEVDETTEKPEAEERIKKVEVNKKPTKKKILKK